MARDDEFMLSSGDRDRRARKRKKRIVIIVGIAAFLLVAALLARPVRRGIRGWQARRHAAKAFTFLDQQKWTEARDAATAAYQLAPREPQAIRAVARLLSKAGQADALEYWKNLADVAPLTRDDLRDETRVALHANDLTRAIEAAQQLLDSKRSAAGPTDWIIVAEVDLHRQANDEARQLLNKVLADNQSTRREQLQATIMLGNLAQALRNSADMASADQRLVALSHSTDDVSLDALIVLASRASTSEPGTFTAMSEKDLEQAIDSHPVAKTPQKLVAVDLEISQHKNQRNEIIQRTIDRWKNSDSDSLRALAAWLYRNGEYQRLVDAIPLERALQTRELFLQYVDALGALNRWDQIRKIIETERFPLDPVYEHMYLARCFMQQGQPNGAENNWQRALEDAAGDTSKLMILGDYAEKNGALPIAAKAFDAAVIASPKLRTAHQGRLRVAYTSRDTKNVHAALADMLKIWPNDNAVQNDEAYTRLLLIDPARANPASPAQLKEIETTARKLVDLEPKSLPHRTVLALVLLKENRAADALAIFQNLNVPSNVLTPSAVLVHAAVLAANGHHSDAAKEYQQIPLSRLLPEELAIYKPITIPAS